MSETKIDAWVVPAISDDKILPTTLPPNEQKLETSIRACKGQRVPVSFCIRSDKPLVGLRADVISPGFMGEVDIRYVTCWWQSGDQTVVRGEPTLTPELLLKDTAMVIPDNTTKRNVLRDPMQDTTELQPIYLEENHTQQYLVTITVPTSINCKPFLCNHHGAHLRRSVTYILLRPF